MYTTNTAPTPTLSEMEEAYMQKKTILIKYSVWTILLLKVLLLILFFAHIIPLTISALSVFSVPLLLAAAFAGLPGWCFAGLVVICCGWLAGMILFLFHRPVIFRITVIDMIILNFIDIVCCLYSFILLPAGFKLLGIGFNILIIIGLFYLCSTPFQKVRKVMN